jgi:hypothetical protein
MSALQLIVTTAGRAALTNATNNGTAPVLLAAVGVTATAFSAGPDTPALPGEIKRIATIAGGVTAADTLHVTIRDDSTDTYTVRGLALYLDDGTLFASFGQADVLLQKSTQASMLIAMDVQFADIDATDITVGDTNFQLNTATTEVQGVVELATDAETITGTDPGRAVVPKGLKAALDARFGAGAPSAFVKGLLTAATAAAFRLLLGLKAAATFDPGAGNGLDADLLDGQHGAYYRQWGNLQGVPASFPPSPHPHSAADITSGTLAVARGGTGAGSYTAGSYLIGNGTSAFGVKTPAQVLTDINAAAKVHTHAWADLNDPPSTATRWPSVAEVTGLTSALAAKLGKNETATAAAKLATARSITLTGLVTGTTSFDGGANVSLGTAIADGALSIGKTDGLAAALAALAPINSPVFTGKPIVPNSGMGIGVHLGLIYETSDAGSVGIRAGASSPVYWTFRDNGDFSCANGAVIAAGGFQTSDRRLKCAITPRAVQSGLALAVARRFSSWVLKATGRADVGVVAQDLQSLAPYYVITDANGYLAIDKAGVALESAMDLALQVDALQHTVSDLTARLTALETRA